MKKMLLLTLLFYNLLTFSLAQYRPANNNFDPLKKDIRALGNMFKKAGNILVTINGIDSTDSNLFMLRDDFLKMPGVKKLNASYSQGVAKMKVNYKGNTEDFLNQMSQASRQMFSPSKVNDTTIALAYKFAKPVAAKPTATAASASSTKSSSSLKGTMLLFKNVKSKLSEDTKNMIFSTLGFKLSKDMKQFTATEDEGGEYPFDAFVYPADLNKDGKEEVFILFGNSYTSGMTGSSAVAFIADKSGVYKLNLGFPTTLPDVLASSNLGYPDLLMGGPGFEFPIWRWNGKAYEFFKSIKEADLKKIKPISLEAISKTYCSSIK